MCVDIFLVNKFSIQWRYLCNGLDGRRESREMDGTWKSRGNILIDNLIYPSPIPTTRIVFFLTSVFVPNKNLFQQPLLGKELLLCYNRCFISTDIAYSIYYTLSQNGGLRNICSEQGSIPIVTSG